MQNEPTLEKIEDYYNQEQVEAYDGMYRDPVWSAYWCSLQYHQYEQCG